VRGTIFKTEFKNAVSSVWVLEDEVTINALDPETEVLLEGGTIKVGSNKKTKVDSRALPTSRHPLQKERLASWDLRKNIIEQKQIEDDLRRPEVRSVLARINKLSFETPFPIADLPEAGLTPDSPLYFVEKITDAVGTVFTFGVAAKINRQLVIAEKRLAEAQFLADQGSSAAVEAIRAYAKQFSKVITRVKLTGNAEGAETVARVTNKHLQVLEGILGRVPIQAREPIEKALEIAKHGQTSSLDILVDTNPSQAVEIGLKSLKASLKKTKVEAAREDSSKTVITLAEYERLRDITEEAQKDAIVLTFRFSEELTEAIEDLGAIDKLSKDFSSEVTNRIKGVKSRSITSQINSLEDVAKLEHRKAIDIFWPSY